jgi:hypothetical protein
MRYVMEALRAKPQDPAAPDADSTIPPGAPSP